MVLNHYFLRLFVAGLLFSFTPYSCRSMDAPQIHETLQEFLSFKTDRTFVQPLLPQYVDRAKDVDVSDPRFVEIMEDCDCFYHGSYNRTPIRAIVGIEQVLTHQQEALQDNKSTDIRTLGLPFGHLYYGVFHKENGDLVGLVRMEGFKRSDKNLTGIRMLPSTGSIYVPYWKKLKRYLCLEMKYHKKYQGQGFATEVMKGLFQKYQACKFIPSSETDIDTSIFTGFESCLFLDNRASLKCALNSGFRIGRLFGDRVDVQYPYVIPESPPTRRDKDEDATREFLPPKDATLHDRVKDIFDRYLSRENSSNEPEKILKKLSLSNLLAVDGNLFEKALNSEVFFLVRTMGNFPQLFDDYLKKSFLKKLLAIRNVLSKLKAPPVDDISANMEQEHELYVEALEKSKKNSEKLINYFRS